MQSRWMSAVEAKANLLLAFGISWALQVYLVPWLFGISISPSQGVGIVAVFTLSSFVRQYVVRRLFVGIERRRLNHLQGTTVAR